LPGKWPLIYGVWGYDKLKRTDCADSLAFMELKTFSTSQLGYDKEAANDTAV